MGLVEGRVFLSRRRGWGVGDAQDWPKHPLQPRTLRNRWSRGNAAAPGPRVLPPDLRSAGPGSDAVLRSDVPCQELGMLTLMPPGGLARQLERDVMSGGAAATSQPRGLKPLGLKPGGAAERQEEAGAPGDLQAAASDSDSLPCEGIPSLPQFVAVQLWSLSQRHLK